MINPFQYGGVVGKEAFCNRKKELSDLISAMRNGERLFLYSERRLGKTSLVRLALSELPKHDYLTAYIDLWPTEGEESLALVTAKAITESLTTSLDKMMQIGKSFFGKLTPSITTDSDGNPRLAFECSRSGVNRHDLEEVLSAPGKIAVKRKKRVVVVFDEFQRILEYGSDLAERTLRSVIQNQPEVSYIFLGSRKHLIQKMFLDHSRPLYRAGGHYPLGPIDVIHWIPFIRERFEKSKKEINEGIIRSGCMLSGGHPFYTQHLFHALWERCESGSSIKPDHLETAISLLLDRENYAYTGLWETLTMNQRRFLIGLAQEPEGFKVFSSEFLQRYNLRTSSNVQRVVQPLLIRDIIDRENGSYIISDRFFKIWITKNNSVI